MYLTFPFSSSHEKAVKCFCFKNNISLNNVLREHIKLKVYCSEIARSGQIEIENVSFYKYIEIINFVLFNSTEFKISNTYICTKFNSPLTFYTGSAIPIGSASVNYPIAVADTCVRV